MALSITLCYVDCGISHAVVTCRRRRHNSNTIPIRRFNFDHLSLISLVTFYVYKHTFTHTRGHTKAASVVPLANILAREEKNNRAATSSSFSPFNLLVMRCDNDGARTHRVHTEEKNNLFFWSKTTVCMKRNIYMLFC